MPCPQCDQDTIPSAPFCHHCGANVTLRRASHAAIEMLSSFANPAPPSIQLVAPPPPPDDFARKLWNRYPQCMNHVRWFKHVAKALASFIQRRALAEEAYGRSLQSLGEELAPAVASPASVPSSLAQALQSLQRACHQQGDLHLELSQQLASSANEPGHLYARLKALQAQVDESLSRVRCPC